MNKRLVGVPDGLVKVETTLWDSLPPLDIRKYEDYLKERFTEQTRTTNPISQVPEHAVGEMKILKDDDVRAVEILKMKLDKSGLNIRRISELMLKSSIPKFVDSMGKDMDILEALVELVESEKRAYIKERVISEEMIPENLNKVDRFIHDLVQIPNFFCFMEILALHQDIFVEKEERYSEYIKVFLLACGELRGSTALHTLISCIFEVGKFLRDDPTSKGFDLSGEKLEYISRFKDKSPERRPLLLDCLQILQKEHPGTDHIASLKYELKNVRAVGHAKAITAGDMSADIAKWRKQHGNIKDKIESQKVENEDSVMNSKHGDILGSIGNEIDRLVQIGEDLANVYFETAFFFGLNPMEEGNPIPPSDLLFRPVAGLVRDFISQWKEEEEKKSREMKRGGLKIKKKKRSPRSDEKNPGVLDEVMIFDKEKLRHRPTVSRRRESVLARSASRSGKTPARKRDVFTRMFGKIGRSLHI